MVKESPATPRRRIRQRRPRERPPAVPIGRALAAFRVMLGVRAGDLAGATGITKHSLSKLECGARRPDERELPNLAATVARLALTSAQQLPAQAICHEHASA